MQAGGRLVEQKQRAFARQRLAAGGGAFGCAGQKTGEFEPLRFTAAQRRHRLAQLHIFQPDINDGLQRPQHLAVARKQRGGFAHRQRQHLGHVQRFAAAFDGDFENLGPIALAVAVGAAQIDVAQKLHFNVLKARAAAGRAAAVAVIEAEFGRGVAAFARQRRSGEQRAQAVPRADVAGRVGARSFANR